jgi:UPF0716 protein FxsA
MTTGTTSRAANPLWLLLAGIAFLPFIELAAFLWVAGKIGGLAAVLALVATSFVGASLLRRQGGLALSRLVAAFRRGEAQDGAARESLMVALGGFLMILPGFVSDAIGFALILPSLLRSLREGSSMTPSGHRAGAARRDPQSRVIDLAEGEWRAVEERPPSAI